jgi:hypothetical protein
VYVDRRVDDRRFTPIDLPNPCGNEVRVGNEIVHSVSGANIPDAKTMKHVPCNPGTEAAGQLCFSEILMLKIPGVTGGGVADTDVKLVRTGKNSF